MASGIPLPSGADRILDDAGIRGKEGESMMDCLTDEHPVKKVPMQRWQFMEIQRGLLFKSNGSNAMVPAGLEQTAQRESTCQETSIKCSL